MTKKHSKIPRLKTTCYYFTIPKGLYFWENYIIILLKVIKMKRGIFVRFKRFIAVIIIFLLLLSSGCINTNNTVENGKDEDITGNMFKKGLPIVKEPVTVTMVARKRSLNGYFDDMKFLKDVEAKTKVHVEWKAIPESQYDQKKYLMLSSRELPDAFFGPFALWKGDLVTYGAQGLFIPLEDLIEKYAPNIKRAFKEHPEMKQACVTPDGHIYSIPRVLQVGVSGGRNNMFIYKPWLDKLNLKIPDTLDDFYKVLKAFKTEDPNGNGKQDEIPYSFMFNNNAKGMGPLFGAFGLVDNIKHLVVEDDRVVFTTIQPEYKEAIKYFHQYFVEGLMDREGFTQGPKQYFSKGRTEDVIIGSFMAWNDFDVAGPERKDNYVIVPPIAGPSGKRGWPCCRLDNNGIHTTGFTITSACKHPDVLIRWVDQFYKPETSLEAIYGPVGINLKENDDGSYDFLPTPEGFTYDEFRFRNTPVDAPGAIFAEDFGTLIPRERSAQKKYNDIQKYYKPYMTGLGYPGVMYTSEETEILQLYEQDILNYVNDMKIKWLTEGGIEQDWNQYLQNLNKMKLEKILNVYQKAYNRFVSSR